MGVANEVWHHLLNVKTTKVPVSVSVLKYTEVWASKLKMSCLIRVAKYHNLDVKFIFIYRNNK